ncbi:hypothetical protein EVAR_427_1 [Eumeta japonica]|uniref:Uncharacterized protein n=1 Tax=Eumeta variegata TaxID=151549 RepID=A0A4C1SD13_EUMVA|nr:hypothetical protein EVAR_427_1 [Eumeta japonica]
MTMKISKEYLLSGDHLVTAVTGRTRLPAEAAMALARAPPALLLLLAGQAARYYVAINNFDSLNRIFTAVGYKSIVNERLLMSDKIIRELLRQRASFTDARRLPPRTSTRFIAECRAA